MKNEVIFSEIFTNKILHIFTFFALLSKTASSMIYVHSVNSVIGYVKSAYLSFF